MAKKFLTDAEWITGTAQPAATDIVDPFGKLVEKAGHARDGVPSMSGWQRRGLELHHGGGPLPDPAMERVHHLLIIPASSASKDIPHAARYLHSDWQQRLADLHDLSAI